MSNLKHIISIAAVHTVGLLSIDKARSLGAFLGNIAYLLNTRMAQVTRKNLSICMPKLSTHDSEQMLKSSLQATGKTAAEVCVLWTGKQSPLGYISCVTGEETLKSLYSQKKGLIVLAPHLGNWEMLGHYLETIGHVTNLYQPPKLKGLEPLIKQSRKKAGCDLVPANIRGVALLLKSLQAGGITGILPDQNPNDIKSGTFVPFFGEPALTVNLVHKLINRTGCNVIFAFAKRVDSGFELIFREPPVDIYADDMNIALAAMNQGIESLVKEAPEQYQWEYKRFKHLHGSRTQPHY